MPLHPPRPASELPAAELAELNDLLWSLPSTLDPYAILAVLLEKGARLFQAPLSCVYLKEAGAYELAGVYGFTEKKAEQLWGRLDLANREPQPLHLSGAELHALGGFGKRRLGGLLAMPLTAAHGLLGWVIFARLEPAPFTEIELNFMSVILERVGASVENALLYQQTESRSQELALLYEIAQLLVSTVNLDELLDQLTARMVDTFDLTFCAIRLYDRASETLVLKAHHHKDPEVQAHLLSSGVGRPMKVGEGIAGTIFRQRKAHVARDIEQDPLLVPVDKELLGPGSLVTVPLFVRGKPLGLLYWMRTGRQRVLTEAVVPLAMRLGNLVAVAIDNAQLYQEMELKIAERTADLREAHEKLEARVAHSREELTQVTLTLRSQLQNVLGYGDLLHNMIDQGANRVHLQKDYLTKMITSAEEVSDVVENLMRRLRAGELG
jgi:GAF domain-containing protein